jgi:benzylsuccinate CoA-transferase BbsE subunit
MSGIGDSNDEGMLRPYRALDLTDQKGFLCARALSDLGCDVIKIEKPGGDKARGIGPFYNDIYHPEKSLYWFAFNANKRGITLDIETADGREIFKELVKTADFVIESFPVGYLDGLGLGYEELSRINDRIILSSITPFGDEGPYKDYKASDLVGMAMGGMLYICGDADRPPVGPSFPTAYLIAAAEAAVGTLLALQYRWATDKGTRVVASLQDEVLLTSWDASINWIASKRVSARSGQICKRPNVTYRMAWPCQDGYVTFFYFGGKTGAPGNRAIVEWMESEGIDCRFAREQDWDNFDWDNLTQEEVDRLEEPLAPFFMRHTKAELYEGAVRRDIILYPMATARDTCESPQLEARNFWQQIEHPELGTAITYPGAFVKASGSACKIYRRAPLIGEHNQEIYEKELGYSRDKMVSLKQAGVI